MAYQGDLRLGATLDFNFSTVYPNASGIPVPTTLAGSPVLSAYVGSSTTEIIAGITLTVDFDGRTGLHHVTVVASTANGFTLATDVTLVITTGTVGGVSVVGMQVGSFSIENRSSLALRRGLAQAGAAGTLTLDAAANGSDGYYAGAVVALLSGTGAGQHRIISTYTGVTKLAAVERVWTTTPDSTSVFALLPGEVDVETWLRSAVFASGTAGVPDVDVRNWKGSLAPANTGDAYAALTGAQAEPAGAPSVNPSPLEKIGRQYQVLRNKLVVNSGTGQLEFYSDAGALLWSKALTDVAGVYTEQEGS